MLWKNVIKNSYHVLIPLKFIQYSLHAARSSVRATLYLPTHSGLTLYVKTRNNIVLLRISPRSQASSSDRRVSTTRSETPSVTSSVRRRR